MEEEMDEEEQFPADEIDNLLGQIVEEVLKDANWDEEKVPGWINTVCEKAMHAVVSLNRPYKWMVTCVLQQKIGATCHSTMSCHWANPADGVHTFLFPQA